MFIIYQDYHIISDCIPVLTHQGKGQFEPQNCYFFEFSIKSAEETKEKIKTLCKPFAFNIGIQQKILKHNPANIQRLFLLASTDIVKNNFQNTDDFLAFALCDDGPKSTEIQFFEVNYKFRHSYEPDQKYRRVGTSALNALKEIYQTRELCGESALEALKFWLKNDFILTDDSKLRLQWRQK